jgi:rare lipoprotein A
MGCGGGVGSGLVARLAVVGGACVLLAQCSQAPSGGLDPKYGVSASPRLVALGEPVPKGGGVYRVGKPYSVAGQTYNPEENPNYSAEGLASWYGEDFHGRATANGEIFDMSSITAAHPTLPIPSYVRVTNLANRKSIIVRVNDRGPYHQGRLIDVSVRTARLLRFYDAGVTRVRVDYVGRAALEGSDDTKLAATLRSGTPAPGPAELRLASSRAFLPQSAEPMPGSVPLPADRPYELGHEEASSRVAKRSGSTQTASIGRQSVTPVEPPQAAARVKAVTATAAKSGPSSAPARATAVASAPAAVESNQWEHSFANRFVPAGNLPAVPTGTGPMSAFAGPAPANNGAVVSGRGLY